MHGDLLYVLDTGGGGGIAGFRTGANGTLTAIAGSARPLSNGGTGTSPAGAQIGFSPDGGLLVVTEKDTGLIDVYPVATDGAARTPVTHRSAGPTPSGFGFTPAGALLVAEAHGSTAGAASLSSYGVSAGLVTAISASVPDTQTGAGWLALTPDGARAFTTNADSGTVSSYRVAGGGLTLRRAVAADTGAGARPADVRLTGDGRFAYVLQPGSGRLTAFRVRRRAPGAHPQHPRPAVLGDGAGRAVEKHNLWRRRRSRPAPSSSGWEDRKRRTRAPQKAARPAQKDGRSRRVRPAARRSPAGPRRFRA